MTPERLDDLLNRFLDDQLGREELQELTSALDQDEEARRAFVRAIDQHQALREMMRPAIARKRSPVPWAILGAVAACAAIALAVHLLRPETKQEPTTFVPREIPPPPAAPLPAPPAPTPTPRPEPTPGPAPSTTPPPPTPAPAPREPEKPPAPFPPQPAPPEIKPEKPPAPPPVPRKETTLAVATLESGQGDVYVISEAGQRHLAIGHGLTAGQGIETGGGESAAVLVFPDFTRLELKPNTTVSEISVAGGKRILLWQGTVIADVPRQPGGQAMTLATRHAEAVVVGTRIALSCGQATRLEVKEGRVKLTRLEDKRAVEVAGGQYAVAGKGLDFTPKRTTRGPMMAGSALWGEDFQEPREIEKDWLIQRNGLNVTVNGQLEFDLAGGGDASLNTRASFAPPFRATVEAEFTQRLRGTLLGFRLQSWKEGKALVHADLDEDRYYLTSGEQTVTADATRKNPRHERWTIEVGADGGVSLQVEGKTLLKGRLAAAGEEFHVVLLAKARRDAPAGARVRFDNLVVERIK